MLLFTSRKGLLCFHSSQFTTGRIHSVAADKNIKGRTSFMCAAVLRDSRPVEPVAAALTRTTSTDQKTQATYPTFVEAAGAIRPRPAAEADTIATGTLRKSGTRLFIALVLSIASLATQAQQVYTIKGQVLSSADRQPLAGATIQVVNTPISTKADQNGNFAIASSQPGGKLRVSFLSHRAKEVDFDISRSDSYTVMLDADENSLDEVQIIGYGQTTKRFNTGSVASISAKEIEQQPVTNVLSALSGRMPGVFVQTTNGLPGGNINIQIRGTGSIAAGTQPLYIIDGVPYNSSFGNLTSLSSLVTDAVNGLVSPLNSLNPNDIESISILKDADATAIYGSRGSNGVVLITTKKGSVDRTRVAVDISSAINEVTNMPKLLSAEQYFMLREEAFSNDGITPSADPASAAYAPELTVWDRTNLTDWSEFFLDGTGHITNVQTSISGGSQRTNYSLSGNYRHESTYLPGENLYKRGSLTANIRHTSANEKFSLQFSNVLAIDDNRLVNPAQNIALNILLPPNYPVRNPDESYNWYWSNPVAELNQYSKARTDNLITNLMLKYAFHERLSFSVSGGYNRNSLVQRQVFPEVSLYPGSINYTQFGNNGNNTFIVEPQLNYNRPVGNGTLTALVGGTYQNSTRTGEYIRANNFLNPVLMENLGSASDYLATNSVTHYRYASVFGRFTYNYLDRYIVNASLRRDASSRFGPDNRIGHFGAVGAAWLFGQESFIKSAIPFLSYGKLRGSFGTTGNDQISDYQYMATYGSSGRIYEGIPTLIPQRIANADYRWESTVKTEVAVELGLFNDRILLNANRYNNVSNTQLVSYAIPSMTGFSSYQANLPAKVRNTGWEIELVTQNIKKDRFQWTTTFNITFPKNVLESFENHSTSSYANTLVIGEDINRIYGYRFSRLDDNGMPLYITQSGEETQYPSSQTDAFFTIGRQTPDFFGGIGNTFIYRGWTLDIFGQFSKQRMMGGLNYYTTGSFLNSYAKMLDRWTETNPDTDVPRASTVSDFSYWQSSGNFFDASFFRLKNVALSYDLHGKVLGRLRLNGLRVYFQAQNALTIWNRDSAILDPESGALGMGQTNLPPTRTFLLGLRLTF